MSALPPKYTASIHDRSYENPKIRTRDSQSPANRDYEQQGGGGGSRRRSPGGRGDRDGGGRYDDRPPRRDGPRDSYGDRGGRGRGGGRGGRGGREDHSDRPRDSGYGGRAKRGGDEEYGEKEREREREMARVKYEENADGGKPPAEAPKPNFGNSGLLAKETNTVKGVTLKYNEPPEARKPLKNWRLYVFKGKEQVDLIHIYKQSAYLVGRDEIVTDIQVEHPSCSKQHAAIQFRQIQEKNEYGDVATSVKPFIIDLDSTNGTYVNDEEIPKTRYYELRNTDVVKFGTSTREYVLLHEDASA